LNSPIHAEPKLTKADGRLNFFKIDQTALENQGLLWRLGKRCQDTDLDRHLGVCADRSGKKWLNFEISLYTFLQILSISVFE
jgi:hypothetical protein